MPGWSSGFGRKPIAPGEIVDLDGRVLGTHRGVVHFTIGQRRGIEIGGQTEPLYVVRIEPEEQRLVVGPRRALAVEAMRVEELNWIAEDQAEVDVKVRSLAPPVPATHRRRPGALCNAGIWRRARASPRSSMMARACSAAAGSPRHRRRP